MAAGLAIAQIAGGSGAAQDAGGAGLRAPAFVMLTAVIALAPLPLGSNRPWAWSLMSLLVGAALVLWGLGALVRPDRVRLSWRRHGVMTAIFAALCLWLAFQTTPLAPAGWHDPLWALAAGVPSIAADGAISADPATSRGGLMRLICYAGVFWLAAQYGGRQGGARAVLWTIAGAAALYAAYGLAVYASGNERILWQEKWAYPLDLTATFVNRNNFADYAGLGLLSALALLVQTARRALAAGAGGIAGLRRAADALPARCYLLLLGCVGIATALALSHSRGGLISTILGVVVLLGALGAARGRGGRGAIVGGALVLALLLAVFDASGAGTARRLTALAGDGTGRGEIHDVAWRAMAEAPLLGRGLDSFPALYYRHRDGAIPWHSPPYDKAHGAWLEFMLEAGAPAAAAMAALAVAVVVVMARGVRRRRRDAVYPCLGLAATALVGAHSVLDFGVQIPAVAITFCALAGVAFAQSRPSADYGRDCAR